MNKIQILPELIVNQIAAGEIVERPASVIKELIENSIDAGAKRIRVEVESGGKRLMRVIDDGCGMSRNDAILAFEKHATSKIKSLEDLTAIKTLGFRGEALSSIASVSRVELITKIDEETSATKVKIEGGKIIDVTDAARPRGTTVTVKDLFFNTPARKKFMRSEATENYHIIAVLQHYGIAYPELAFSLTKDGREVLNLTPAKNLKERIFQIFGAELVENLLPVSNESDLKIFGYVSAPHERRFTRQDQYFFVNKRFIRDKIIASAVSEAFRSILPENTHPVVFLLLEIPFEEVDVNVHPAKTEVRFRRKEAVKQAIIRTIHKALKIPLTETISAKSKSYKIRNNPSLDGIQSLVSFLTPLEAEKSLDFSLTMDAKAEIVQTQELHVISEPLSEETNIVPEPETIQKTEAIQPLPSVGKFLKPVEISEVEAFKIVPICQIRNSYIVATDDKGLLLIDQHVAHERILFEKLRKTRKIETQNLLVPETVSLTVAEAQTLNLIKAELEDLGFTIMLLSGRTIAIKGVPREIPPSEVRNIIAEIIKVSEEELKSSKEKLKDEIAAKLACKAAIKVNTPLTQEKMQWLIDTLLYETQSNYTCPHGRPIILRLSIDDIERGFHRK
ncbi:MAG: DNA mismatch repair endonuclease MutL [Pyrinomonadaceae bacterium]|nr:DNA mismatch repair endonuclease MutL [Pyrinomonadaceae bacterium]MCX7638919.1 DNA mismatch repair endonuclease MutL [Pyrinomonadaceae bacterium]MDW8304944.1 DNA mismatch repair endonuclease MutL [Acidobacteriota bacterium]